MNAIDTNVLIRFITKDDKKQAERAYMFVKTHAPVLIHPVVLCETIWVLDRLYKLPRAQISEVVEMLLLSDTFILEDADLLWSALNDFHDSKADFSDIFIGLSNHQKGAITFTFDQVVSRLNYFQLL